MTQVGPAVLIYNPRAGRVLRRPHVVERVAATLSESFGPVRPVPTEGPNTAGAIAQREIEAGAGMVFVCGGDGTVNEVLQFVAGTDIPLGALPGGTACVLANELGLGNDPERAARRLAGATAKEIAIGNLTWSDGRERKFLLMAGIGFDAHIIHGLDLELKDRIGKLAYWRGAIRELGRRLDELDVDVNGTRRRCSFALVSRVRNYGGDVNLARGASLFANDFEILLFEGRSVFRYPFYFAGILLGAYKSMRGLTVLRAESASVTPAGKAEIHIQIDGEWAGLAPVKVEIVPAALRLLTPLGFRG